MRTGHILSDEALEELSPAERAELIARLAQPLSAIGVTRARLRRVRRVRLATMLLSAGLLVPWIVYLGLTLPGSYRVDHWSITWVGFDVILLVVLAATLVLGWKQRMLVLPLALAGGVRVICDAWFDITTADGHDLLQSILSAVIVEIPLGILLISGAVRAMHFAAVRLWAVRPHQHVWDIALPAAMLSPPDPQRTGL